MPHYSTVVNSFEHIRSEIISACVAHGWAQHGNAITKGALAAQFLVVSEEEADNNNGIGLRIQGGTGYNGELISPSPGRPRMGPPSSIEGQPQWPMDLSIHIFTDPDEVYAVVNFSVDHYWFLAFGQSAIELPGTGMWLGATSPRRRGAAGVSISPTGGASGNLPAVTGALFWRTSAVGNVNIEHCVHADLPDAQGWQPPSSGGFETPGNCAVHRGLSPLLSRSPSSWNSEAILLPMQLFMNREEGKRSLVVDLHNARALRIDNYVPGQIIALGDDQWRVYPWYRKNADARDGGNNINHSGTLGWAIRYDPQD